MIIGPQHLDDIVSIMCPCAIIVGDHPVVDDLGHAGSEDGNEYTCFHSDKKKEKFPEFN